MYDTDGVAVAVIWTLNPDGIITTVELPGLQGGGSCHGRAINNPGSVVGFCIDAAGNSRAVHWNASGEITDLEDLYGMDLGASDINDAGQIVAIENVPTPPGQEEPELDRTFVLDLDNGPPTRIEPPFVYGFGINLAGQVVGQSDGRVPNDPRPLWWTKVGGNDRVIELGFLSETGWAQAINDDGLIVGGDGSDVQQPIMWNVVDNGGVRMIEGLGTLGGSRGWATDVNNAGQVVGATTTKKGKRDSEHRFAFFWENRQFTKLDMLKRFSHKSDAVALNDHGFVAGNVYNSNHRSKAIVWVPR